MQSEDDLVTALTGTQQPPTSTQVPSETTPSTSDSIEVVSTEDVVISDSADVVNESTDDTSESTETATECVLSKRLDKIVSERGCAKRAMDVQAERMVNAVVLKCHMDRLLTTLSSQYLLRIEGVVTLVIF